MEIIKTRHLTKTYGQGETLVHALKDINLTISEGEFVAIVGSSGSGKSTLLQMLGGLDTPTEGEIEVSGRRLANLSDEELTIYRRRNVGFVFQSYNLSPILSIAENITLPLMLDGKVVDADFFEEVVTKLKIQDKLSQLPNTLSGGQQQRVAIARALVTKPAIILADEPTGNLDSQNSLEVVSLLKSSAYLYNQTIAVVTHDEEVAQMADRMIRLEDGQILQGGY